MRHPLRVWLVDPNSNTLPYDQALADALTSAGCQVECLISPSLYEPLPISAPYRRREHFFRLATGPLARRLGLAQTPQLRRLVKGLSYPIDWLSLLPRLISARPDIVHIQWSVAPAFDGRLWQLLHGMGIPIVYTAHNLLPHDPQPGDDQRYRALYQTADAVVVHTERSAQALGDAFAVPRSRIVVAPHGPLLVDEPAIERAAARRQLGLPPTDPLVLFTGLIEPYKGLDVLIEAFIEHATQSPRSRLVIAGRPNTSIQPLCDRLAAAGLTERLHLDLRYLPQSTLAAYLCAADVVALPYRSVTSSGLLMAARRYACPVIATSVGDFPSVIRPAETGLLVPPGDAAALASALQCLVHDPALARRLGEAGRRAALTEAAWSVAAAASIERYRQLRSARGRGGR